MSSLPAGASSVQPGASERLSRAAWLPQGWSAGRASAVVFLFGSIIRLAALYLARDVPFVSDAREYVDVASLLLSGRPFVPYWPSGLPLYLLPFVASGAFEPALRAAMLVFWAMACWGIWRLMRALGLGSYAWLVLLLFAVMPSSIQMSIEPLTQQAVAALLLVALSAAVRCGLGAGLAEYTLLGLSLGWMALMRPSALPLLLLLPIVCLLATRSLALKTPSARRLAGPILSVVLGTLMIFAWMVRAHQLCGAWIINNSNAANLYFGNNPWTPLYRTWYFGSSAKYGSAEIHQYPEFEQIIDHAVTLPEFEASREFKRMAVDYIVHRPDMFLLRTVNRMRCFFGFDTFTSANLRSSGDLGRHLFPLSLALEAFLYLSIAGPAFFWLAAAPAIFWRQWQSWLLAGTILIYSAPYWLSMSHPTYHYPIVMPLAILGLLAWKTSQDRASNVTYTSARGWVAVAALAAIQVEWMWQLAGSLRR